MLKAYYPYLWLFVLRTFLWIVRRADVAAHNLGNPYLETKTLADTFWYLARDLRNILLYFLFSLLSEILQVPYLVLAWLLRGGSHLTQRIHQRLS